MQIEGLGTGDWGLGKVEGGGAGAWGIGAWEDRGAGGWGLGAREDRGAPSRHAHPGMPSGDHGGWGNSRRVANIGTCVSTAGHYR